MHLKLHTDSIEQVVKGKKRGLKKGFSSLNIYFNYLIIHSSLDFDLNA